MAASASPSAVSMRNWSMRILLADLAHGETDMDQHPIAGSDAVGFHQADVYPAADADHVDQSAMGGVVHQGDDLSGNGEAHVSTFFR